MGNLLLIDEDELKKIIREAVDSATRKVAAKSAVVNYRNRLFTEESPRQRPARYTSGCGYDDNGASGGCGSGGGGCGISGWNNGGC